MSHLPPGARHGVRPLILGLCLCAAAAGPRPAAADENIDNGLKDAVKQVTKYLTAKGITSVSVGTFRSRSEDQPTPGTAITRSLTQQFKEAKFTVARNAPVEIRGDFQVVIKEPEKKPSIRVNLDFQDKSTRSNIFSIEKDIDNLETVATQAGVTANLTPNASDAVRAQEVADHIEKPKASVVADPKPAAAKTDAPKPESSAGVAPVPSPDPPAAKKTRVKADEKSPYAIEILVKGVPVPVELKDGVSFVNLSKDDTYEVKLINDSTLDASVALSIDGLSMFTFSDLVDPKGRPLYKRLVVLAGQKWPVKGWHRTDSAAYQFQVSDYAQSAAGKEIRDAADPEVGTITATFGAAWPEGAEQPSDEPVPDAHKRSVLATKLGPVVGDTLKPKKYNFGVIRAMISVRYNKGG